MSKIWTEEALRNFLKRVGTLPKGRPPIATIEKAIMFLWGKQTPDEQDNQMTRWSNGRGFDAFDALYFSDLVKKIKAGRWLSYNETARAAQKLVKYSRQLMELVDQEQRRK